MTSDEMTCAELMDQLMAFLDGELAETDCDAIRHHLLACEDCLDQAEAEEKIRVVVRKACRCQAPDELTAKVAALYAAAKNTPK